MKKQTNTDLRRKLREQRAAYEELLGLSGAILAALCVRCGDGATVHVGIAGDFVAGRRFDRAGVGLGAS